MKLQIVLTSHEGVGARVSWAEMPVSEEDLNLPYDEFSKRFLEPAFHHLKLQDEGQKANK